MCFFVCVFVLLFFRGGGGVCLGGVCLFVYFFVSLVDFLCCCFWGFCIGFFATHFVGASVGTGYSQVPVCSRTLVKFTI